MIYYCETCGKEHDGTYASGRFCCVNCAKAFSSHKNIKGLKKNVKCSICGNQIEIGKNALNDSKYHICEDCRKKKKEEEKINKKLNKKCPICGEKNCQKEFCKKHNKQQFQSLIKYFGFDKNKLGTLEVEKEFQRVRNILYDLYWIQHLNTPQIGKLFNYKSTCNIPGKIFKYLEIPSKSVKESVQENLEYNRMKTGNGGNGKYHDGWHTTWNEKEVYLRSSFEFDFAKELDEQKIEYEVEFKHIKYFDTQLNEYRCAIPDFYIPSTNTIIEIKSKWTLDKQNMKDKFKAYRELGYNCKLICDYEELII